MIGTQRHLSDPYPMNQTPYHCRICLEVEPPPKKLPCSCKDQLSLMHQKCFETWIQKNIQDRKISENHRVIACQICKKPIAFSCEFHYRCKPYQQVNCSGLCRVLPILIVIGFLIFLIVRISQELTDQGIQAFLIVILVIIAIVGILLIYTLGKIIFILTVSTQIEGIQIKTEGAQ